MIFNPLVGDYVPWLAERYAWSEDRTTLCASPCATASAGPTARPSRARDVVFTFELLKQAQGAGRARPVAAPGRVQRGRRLARSCSRWRRRTCRGSTTSPSSPSSPSTSGRTSPTRCRSPTTNPVATGPVHRGDALQHAGLRDRPQPATTGRPGGPAVSALRFRAYPANEQTILALLDDELDWAGTSCRPSSASSWPRDPAHHRYWFPLIDATVFLYANTRRKPLDDVRVRKALSMAIDRAAAGEGGHARLHAPRRRHRPQRRLRALPRSRGGRAGRLGAARPGRAPARLLDEAGLTRGPDGLAARTATAAPLRARPSRSPPGYSDWVARGADHRPRPAPGRHRRRASRPATSSAWFEQLQTGRLHAGHRLVRSRRPRPTASTGALMSTETVQARSARTSAENWHRFGLPEADGCWPARATADRGRGEAPDRAARSASSPSTRRRSRCSRARCGASSTRSRFTGFPDADNPYAPLSPHLEPQSLLVLTASWQPR